MCYTQTAGRADNPPRLDDQGYLDGKLLVAMPSMRDDRFARAVIYMCAHSEKGAMGLIINHRHQKMTFPDLLARLDIYPDAKNEESESVEFETSVQAFPVHVGGPVEEARGFVLHTSDYDLQESTLPINDEISLTATVDILKDIANGKGPKRAIVALGYSGWDGGQLESEFHANGWLCAYADPNVVFCGKSEQKYDMALSLMGIASDRLSGEAGHA